MSLTFGSLFAGIGGFDLGLERAGMTCLWQVEIDDYATRVLEKHWPHVVRYRDVRESGKHNLEPVDLVCGGFPCQPFSLAGKRGGARDDRNLWPEMRRIVAELQPRWVCAENTPGIASLYLDTVLSDVEGLGYEVGVVEIPACGVGAPHIRQRLFVLAHTKGGWIERRSSFAGGGTGERDVADAAGLCRPPIERDEPLRVLRAHGADADGGRQQERAECDRGTPANPADGSAWRPDPDGFRDALADADGAGLLQPGTVRGGAELTGAESSGDGGKWWCVEPSVCRVAHGVPHRVDRLRCLGNAVVPQVVEVLGRAILEVEAASGNTSGSVPWWP